MKLLPTRPNHPQRLLRDALRRVETTIANSTGSPTDVQLLAQVSGSRDWPRIFEYWTRRSGMTGGWPRALPANELVLNLWPIAPETLRLTTGIGGKPEKRQPRKLLSTPWVSAFDPSGKDATSEGALLHAIPRWIDDVIAHNEYPNGMRLAPPILETWNSKGHLQTRTILTFELDWQLPPAENTTWPPPPSPPSPKKGA